MVKRFSAMTALAWIACSAAVCSGAAPAGRDVSNRCSLASPRTISSWGDGGTALESMPGHPASKWRKCRLRPESPLDLSESTVVAFDLLAPEGPGRDSDARLLLRNGAGAEFEAVAHIIPTLWQRLAFDVSNCPFLTDICEMEIAVRNQSDLPWTNDKTTIGNIVCGKPLDLSFDVQGAAERFSFAGGSSASQCEGTVTLSLPAGSSARISTEGSRNAIYNPDLTRRNTVEVAVTQADTRSLTLAVETDKGKTVAKTVDIKSGCGPQILQYNFSDLPQASGRVTALTLSSPQGGDITVDRISFECESPILPNAGKITLCTANKKIVTVKGEIDAAFLPGASKVEIRLAPHWKTELPFDSLELLTTAEPRAQFSAKAFPNSRLDGKMTHLSSRFRAALRMADGSAMPLGDWFFVSNWRSFLPNPYEFDTSDNNFNVLDFGACGDGITNDNKALQAAIDNAVASGGGRVTLPGGHRFIATCLQLGRGVELFIAPGAELRQSPDFSHYEAVYSPEYGHDNVIPGIPWTHCMYTNLPLILAKDTDHVKITGGGTIRMDDTFSENPLWTHYAKNCSDRIHIVPIAVCNTSDVEISDINIVRCNNYHTIFYRAERVFLGNVKLDEVTCLSGDGFSFGNAVRNVRVARCIYESNDDGIVLCSSYKDPRGGGWRERVDTIDSSVRNIEVLSSYIDGARGGGGKAIALIPWGSTNPRQDWNEIDGITVRDCVLRGGHSVGSWSDNPFDGKPFDNCEKDDYAPVKNFNITGNEYLSLLDLNGVVPTGFVTDCGLHGSSSFKNASFDDRTAYWTLTGNVSTPRYGSVRLEKGSVSQGLYLTPGRYRLEWRAEGNAKPFAKTSCGKKIKVNADGEFALKAEDTVFAGVSSSEAVIYEMKLIKLK